jgi:hypothetical protein
MSIRRVAWHLGLFVGSLALPAEENAAVWAAEAAAPVAGTARVGNKPALVAGDNTDPFMVGVTNSMVPPDLRASLNLLRREGILIMTVYPNSPAQKAGLLSQDVVLAIDGRKVSRRRDLITAIQASQGRKISLDVVRDRKRSQIEMTPVRRSAISNVNIVVPAKPVPTETPQRQVLQQYLSCLRLAVVRGRLTNLGTWPMFGSSLEIDQGTLREDLDSGASDKSGCVDYECTTAQQVVRLEIDSAGYFACSSLPANGSRVVPVKFVQAPGEPLTLTVGKDGPQIYRAETVWHLVLSHPEACRRHLLPLLMQFRSDWQLDKFGVALEDELLKIARTTRWPDRAQWPALVKQLGNNVYQEREFADSQLRAGGPVVLEYLQQLDPDELDFEQSIRIRKIIDSLASPAEETPTQVAHAMAFDPSLWLVFLRRPDPAMRRIAVKQLEGILGAPIPVDPAADPATQTERREELRARVERCRIGK